MRKLDVACDAGGSSAQCGVKAGIGGRWACMPNAHLLRETLADGGAQVVSMYDVDGEIDQLEVRELPPAP